LINPVPKIVALSILIAAFTGCAKRQEDAELAAPVPDVTVTKVERAPISQNLIVSGNLGALPNRDAKVAALVPGRISRVLVIEADRVQEGQALAEIDSTLLHEQERQAEAAVAQAQASVENSKLAAQREEGLLARGVSSRKEVEDARTQLAVNAAALHQAEAGLATANAQLSRATVRAPFAGVVVKRFVGAGEQVDGSAAQPIIEVAQIDTLELIGTVPASRLGEIKVGEAFSFETNAVPGGRFTARVTSVFPAVDPATNNGTVRIRVENAKRQLKFGEYLSIELPLKSRTPRLVVPRQAVYPDESGEPHVYKVKGEEAESVAVKVGEQTAEKAEILEGLAEGELVIVNGGYGLPEKSKVHVKQ